jgi:hypothetical protein
MDWVAWHADYDTDGPLRRRLEIVQRHIRQFLAASDRSPIRVISMCAGEGRDLLGAVASQDRRDLVGRLVEVDPGIAAIARSGSEALGLAGIEVFVGDAGESRSYQGAVPADLVLACGVFGNIEDADVERTIGVFPEVCDRGAIVVWTRHRRPPDLTSSIRRWFTEAGFEEVSFEPVPDSSGSVGVARYAAEPKPLAGRHLFTFTRSDTDRRGH